MVMIAVFVNFDAEPRTGLADTAPDFRRVFSDSRGKDQPVNPAERRGHSSDFLRRAVDEIVYCQPRRGIVALKKFARVAADSGKSQQAGLFVQDRLDLL